MKHLSAERLCSSYTGGEEVWDEGREGQRRRREVRGWGTRAVIFSSGVARASRFPGRRGERGRKGVDLAVAVGGCHAVRRRSRGTDEVSARGSRRSRARPSRGAHASRAPARVPVSNAEKRYAPGWREWATFEMRATGGARAPSLTLKIFSRRGAVGSPSAASPRANTNTADRARPVARVARPVTVPAGVVPGKAPRRRAPMVKSCALARARGRHRGRFGLTLDAPPMSVPERRPRRAFEKTDERSQARRARADGIPGEPVVIY